MIIINKKFKNFLITLGIFILYLIIFVGSQYVLLKVLNIEKDISRVICYVFVTIYLLIILKVTNKFYILKFDTKKFFKGFIVGIPFLLICLFFLFLSLSDTGNLEHNTIGHALYWIFVYLFGAGFLEELISRGITMNLLWDQFKCNNKKNVYLVCLLSGILFGGMHAMNMLGTGYFPIAQILFTTAMGALLAAIYSRTKCFWTLVILHGLWDICASMDDILYVVEETTSSVDHSIANQLMITLPLIIPVIIFFFIILRKKKIHECYEK